MNQFLDTDNLSKIYKNKVNNLNRPIKGSEIEGIMTNLPT